MENLKSISITRILLIAIIIGSSTEISCQNILDSYKWEKRILLIVDSSSEAKSASNQLKLLDPIDQSFEDRKLLIIKVTKSTFQVINEAHSKIVKDSSLFKTYSTDSSDFMLILIGLDGGAKTEQTELITKSELFAIIDGMPMRQAEIRNKN